MRNLKKIISLLITLITVMSVFSSVSMTASAATSSAVANTANELTPIVTYAAPASGASKVYAYSNSSLTAKQTAYYINAYKEQIVIRRFSSNGKAVEITYPNSSGKFRTKWFRTDDILGLTAVKTGTFKASSSMTVYRMKNKSGVTSYGTIAAGNDTCYQLGTHTIGGKTYYTTIYKLSSSTQVNGVKVKYKLGLTSKSGINKTTTKTTNNSSTYSIKNNVVTVNGVKLYEYPVNSKYSSGRYANVNGKSKDMYAWQCCGFARYVQTKLYGKHYFNSSKSFPDVAGSKNVYVTSTSKLKKLITTAGVGAHIRTGANISGGKHSMVIIGITDAGFTIMDANYDGKNTVRVKTYTWNQYLNSNYGKSGFRYIEVYKA